MKPPTSIFGRAARAVKSAVWYRLERVALWILARSGLHVTPATRHRRIVHSEAWRKAPVDRPRPLAAVINRRN